VETWQCDDAEIVVVAYGTMARIVKSAVSRLRAEGIKVGLVRPITLWPYPSDTLAALAAKPEVKAFVSVEMSMGQMVEDVKLAVNGAKPVHFYGRTGGMVPSVAEVCQQIKQIGEGM